MKFSLLASARNTARVQPVAAQTPPPVVPDAVDLAVAVVAVPGAVWSGGDGSGGRVGKQAAQPDPAWRNRAISARVAS